MQRPLGRRGRQLDPLLVGEELAVEGGDLVPLSDLLVQPLELAQAERALEVGDPVIEAELLDLVVPASVRRAGSDVFLRDPVGAERA